MTRSLCFAVALFAAVGSAGCGGGQVEPEAVPSGPVMVAMVRGDGFIVPFAEYADGAWRGPDTEPFPDLTERPAPWFVDRVDSLARWRFITPLGLSGRTGEPVPVQVTGAPVEVQTHCQRAWALPTDLPGTPTPEFTIHQTVGIALSTAGHALQVAELDVTLDETGRFTAFLLPYFNAAETRETARRSAEGGYASRRVGADVAKAPLSITALYRVGGDAATSYYAFEASRVYPAAPTVPPGCDEATVMTGWLAEDASGTLVLLSGDLTMTSCDRKGSPIVQPLGALRLDEHLFVLTVDRHYEGESYTVVRIDPAAASTVLTVYGGGC